LDHIETAPATDQAGDNQRRDDAPSVLVASGSAVGLATPLSVHRTAAILRVMDSWEIIARLSIQQTMARYTHAADGGRSEDFAETFTPDGIMEAAGDPPVVGRAAIVAFLEQQKASLADAMDRRLIRHFVSSLRIDFDSPEEATTSSYFMAVTQIGPDHWGRYRDRFVLFDGDWLIAHRFVRLDGSVPGAWQSHPDSAS
jgi:hypothetical protein